MFVTKMRCKKGKAQSNKEAILQGFAMLFAILVIIQIGLTDCRSDNTHIKVKALFSLCNTVW